MPNQDNPKLFIYDRYGKLLKQLSPNGAGWDGTFNGYPLPADDYWFSITYTENNISKLYKSHFSLKR
jgi:gliding motility-associated-like protein